MQQAIYLIGFSASALNSAPSIPWLAMAGIHSTVIGKVLCWTKEIEREQFDGPESEKNLSDLQWLTPRVLAHDTAVKALSNLGPFLPAKFGTLYSNWDTLRAQVEQIHDSIETFLQRIEGKQEWGLKVYVDRLLALTAFASATGQSIEMESETGTGYLKARLRKRMLEQQLDTWITEQIDHIKQQITNRCSELVERPISNKGESRETREIAANIAFLATEDAAANAIDTLASRPSNSSLERDGNSNGFLELEWSGPWPVYSFTMRLQESEPNATTRMRNAG